MFRNCVLLIASIIFYSWGEPFFTIVMLGSVFIDWVIGLQIGKSKKRKKAWMLLVVCIHVSLLFVFKYLTFTTSQLSLFLPVKVVEIVLPIGISFFTFQMMSYIFDIYYGNVKPQKNILKLALYITMFPQLIAGPIVRYQTVADEIDDRSVKLHDLYLGISRFIVGLSKKVLLADLLAVVADNIFSASDTMGVATLSAWIGAIAFSFEIYFDFSGYSDMAIGLARCFGFHFKENFNYPYIATSVTEFWKRWHISLTDWFRDYVYIPLGGNRVTKLRHVFNLSIVWLLTGIWHGANWTFIVWGIVYLLFQLLEKYSGTLLFRIPAVIRWGGTMLIVCCNWVTFKADNLLSGMKYIGTMFGNSDILIDATSKYYAHQCFRLFLICSLASLPWKRILNWVSNNFLSKISSNFFKGKSTAIIVAKDTVLLIMFLLVIARIINGSYSPFIYFNF